MLKKKDIIVNKKKLKIFNLNILIFKWKLSMF